MHTVTRLLAAGLCVAAVTASHAQVRRLQATPNTGTPSAAQRSAQAAPNPAGLRPLFPAGINSGSGAAQSRDPIAANSSPMASTAGDTRASDGTNTGSNNGTGNGTTPGTANGATPGTTNGSTSGSNGSNNGSTAFGGQFNTDANGNTQGNLNFGSATNFPSTAVMGAGATVRGPGQTTGGAGGFSATDVARSFYFADANHDNELTRAEANRLSLRSMTFEEMDRNFDGIISRFEYDDSMR